MKSFQPGRNRFLLYYETMIWIVYVGLYKYSVYLERLASFKRATGLPAFPKENFPYPVLILFAFAMTLYIIPWYRWIAPRLLPKKSWFALATLAYIIMVPRIADWTITAISADLSTNTSLQLFYKDLHQETAMRLYKLPGFDLAILFTDLLAFLSIIFIRFALDNERKRHQLEVENLHLQLESLKAQLHPHFLFNTLNSLYGMSLTGVPDTPAFILKLSDMMRYILYECGKNKVDLEQDLGFLDNYMAMEKKRYPNADIAFECRNDGSLKQISPLLFIPFIENAFKHGSHRIGNEGYIHGHIQIEKGVIRFCLKNNLFPQKTPAKYGGVGLANVRQRLNHAYPGHHELTLNQTEQEYEASLIIQASQTTNP